MGFLLCFLRRCRNSLKRRLSAVIDLFWGEPAHSLVGALGLPTRSFPVWRCGRTAAVPMRDVDTAVSSLLPTVSLRGLPVHGEKACEAALLLAISNPAQYSKLRASMGESDRL